MSSTVQRIKTSARMSQIVAHGDYVWLSGQVGTAYQSVTEQTEEVLRKVEKLLNEAGSDMTKILTAEVWLDDMRYFDEMNAVWDRVILPGHAPARACGAARLGRPGLWVEIIVSAVR